MEQQDVFVILPEIFLACYAMGALLVGAFSGRSRTVEALFWMTGAFFLCLAGWIGMQPAGERTAFGGAFANDGLARFAKVLILVSSAVILILSQDYLKRERLLRFEFPVLISFAVLGMLVMVSASDLMVLYVGLELQSLALYVLAAYRRDDVRSTEAGLKYFVLGALSSGLLLYGASLTYGFSGTTLFQGIAAASAAGETSLGVLYGLVFILVGLAFKVSAAPFHMWVPDVYEGSPTPVTAFFATAPKVAAIVLLARILIDAFGNAVSDWQPIIAVLAVASMFLGAIAAIGQQDLKRLLAYSSIAHMGYALMGIASASHEGLEGMLVYMAIYATMNVGIFAFVLSMRQQGLPVADIRMLNMLSRHAPARALALLVLLFSLAGIVPMLGFFGKLIVFVAAVEAGLIWLAVSGGIASVIGAYYYLRIVYFMYFGEEGRRLDDQVSRTGVVVLLAAAAIMIIGIVNLFGITDAATRAAAPLFS